MMVWLLTKLRIVRGIYLIDFEHRVYKTWIKEPIFLHLNSKPWCYVFPFIKVGYVVLNEDGTIEQPHFIKEWRYM